MCSVEERQSSIKRKEQRGKRAGFCVGGGCQTGGAQGSREHSELRGQECERHGGKMWEERVLGAHARRRGMLEGKTRMGSKAKCSEVWRL